MQSKRNFIFRSKNASFGYFKLEFEKTIVIVDAATLEFFKMESSVQNTRVSLGQKNALICFFFCAVANFEKMFSYLNSGLSN